MALRHALLLALTATALTLVPQASAQVAECGLPVAVTDAAADQVVYPVVPAPEAVRRPELDVQATTLAVEGGEVVLTATLGAVPTAEPDAYSYRYWFGFHVKPAGGEPEYMDIRMHGKHDLTGAPLITSNERGLERIADLAPAWDGTTATFRFPLALLHDVYGTTDLGVGQPQASTDGPFSQELVMGFPTGVAYQVDRAPDLASDWVAYVPCPAEAAAPAPVLADEVPPTAPASSDQPVPNAARPQDVPAVGAAALALALLALAARRRLP